MRILVIGKNYTTALFANYFVTNTDNIVFTTVKDSDANFLDIDLSDVNEFREFAKANDIDLTILSDENVIYNGLQGSSNAYDFVKTFNEANLSIFAPDGESAKIATSKGFGKRFMYKNKIKTPKFGIFDKLQSAIEYAREQQYPLVIGADMNSKNFEKTLCKSFSKAKIALEKLFEMNVKQVVLENYIEGQKFTLYAISDGYNAFELDYCTQKDCISWLGASFLDDKEREEITNKIVNPVILSLARSKKHYIGLLGFNFVRDTRGNIYLLSFEPFFKDTDTGLFLSAFKEDFAKMFLSAITGALLDDFSEIKYIDLNFVNLIDENGEIHTVYGRTLNEAKENAYNFENIACEV